MEKFKKHSEIILSNKTKASIQKLGLALSSEVRIKMLEDIHEGITTVTALSKSLKIPTSNVVFHINILESAGLIYTEHLSHVMKCHPITDEVKIVLFQNELCHEKIYNDLEYEIPIGLYEKAENLLDSYNLFSKEKQLDIDTSNVYDSSRLNAELISSRRGLLTYPLKPYEGELESIFISFEACSETSAYDNDYKSDISIFINGIELLTYTCPGDFGGRKGLLNPEWYKSFYTQYGELNTIHINKNGVYRNGVLVNPNITIKSIDLKKDNPTLTIGNKPNCKYSGGINLFGKSFGDYKQDIKVVYQVKRSQN